MNFSLNNPSIHNKKIRFILLLRIQQKIPCFLSFIEFFSFDADFGDLCDLSTKERKNYAKNNKQSRRCYLGKDSHKAKGTACSAPFFHSFIQNRGK